MTGFVLPPDALAERLAALEARLQRFEDAAAIRACVTRYMALCDRLDADTPLDLLLDCFTEHAVWAGKGARYGAGFGSHHGRAAIGAMFAGYMGRPAHFALNVHFLTSELITPGGADAAQASWVMLQTSTFADGASHLNAAQLTLAMARCADGHWRIARFETENLFSRPVSHWQSAQALPLPDQRPAGAR
jgi:ketosteroid isomerase-like protein